MSNINNYSEQVWHICYASDNNYAPIAAVSMVSLMENNKDALHIVFHYMADHLSQEVKGRLADTVALYSREIQFYDVDEITTLLKENGVAPFGENENFTTYTRLFIADILPQNIEKVLYLDCDTLVVRNLFGLFRERLDDYIVAGAKDVIPECYCKRIGLAKNVDYINAGVLLINLLRWREKGILERIKDVLQKSHERYWYADQDIINIVMEGKIKIISLEYNCLSINLVWKYNSLGKLLELKENYYNQVEVEEAKKNPVVVHLVECNVYERPWVEGNSGFMADEWRCFLSKTMFADGFVYKTPSKKVKRKMLHIAYRVLPQKWIAVIYGYRMRTGMRKRLLGEG